MATIRTALLSVSDKTGLVEFARTLHTAGVHLLSSGGTARALVDAGIPVETVEQYTGSPEVMGGRVKTLHPRVHGGILAREATDAADLERIGARCIDLVVVNLYPFEEVTKGGCSYEDAVENIDIGGPSMLRSAAKNHARVTAICDPRDYAVVSESLSTGGPSLDLRKKLAAKVFAHTAAYDGMIAGYLSKRPEQGDFSDHLTLPFELGYGLRYGENPHQKGAFYVERGAPVGSLARAESLGAGGKELSFNNLVDADAALEAVRDFEAPAAVVVKHTNPCGVAEARSIAEAYRLARDADSVSAFGGIVALNRPVDVDTARLLAETFLEVVVAPSFDAAALELLRAKKNLRLLATGARQGGSQARLEWKRIGGGIVVQESDQSKPSEVRAGRVVSRREPTPEEFLAMEHAFRVCKHVKSNAIVLAKGQVTVGIGAGQMSRVVSVQLACEKAGANAKGSALGSDAFFPFPDGVEAAARAGVVAIAQPGGSVKDSEVIARADELGLAMVFTGVRHFRH